MGVDGDTCLRVAGLGSSFHSRAHFMDKEMDTKLTQEASSIASEPTAISIRYK